VNVLDYIGVEEHIER